MEFISRIMPSGQVPSEWNHIWGCEVSTQAGRNISVPFRFYSDGQFLVGIGTSEQLGTWRVETPSNSWTDVSLTLDEPAPQFFGSDNTKLEFVLWRHGENYMETGGYYGPPSLAVEDITEFNFLCARYNQAGDVEGEELPGWMQRFEEAPSFITTGDANAQFAPNNEEPDTAPTSDEPASEPVNSPLADPAPTTTEPSNTTAPLADVNAQVKDIWYTGDFVDTVDGVRQIFGTVIEFNNGEVSRDGETISNEGIAASKNQNPEDWGLGRVSSSGLLSYKWSTSRSWLEPYLSATTRSYPRDQKIRGCFETSTGVKGLGSSPLITRLCLVEDGSFRLDDAENNTGNYLIEDHAIRLSFSSGERAEFLFGGYYVDDFIYRVIIADRVFHVTD